MTRKTLGLRLYLPLALALLTTLWIAGPARADEGEALLEVHVPFSFVVENTTLPAGDYLVRELEATPARELEISSRDGAHRVLFLTESVNNTDPAAKSEVVFNEYGNRKFLAQVWTAGSFVGEQLVPARTEKKQLDMGGKATQRRVTAS
jgi:hypothetical protein